MDTLFGLSMTIIMAVLLALFAVAIVTVVAVYASNRVMFRMGLRNVVRRRTQTGLVVVGLMLATVIVTAAFTTGDSLDYSITKATYDNLGRIDITVHGAQGGPVYLDQRIIPDLEAAFRDDPDIEAFVPFLFEPAPALNPRTRQAEPFVMMSGFDTAVLDRFGGLRLVDGRRADLSLLGDGRVFLNMTAADKLDARTGDRISIILHGAPAELEIAGIVEDVRASGALNFGGAALPGMAVSMATVQRLTGHEGKINQFALVLRGGVRGSVSYSEGAADRVENYLKSDAGRQLTGLGESGLSVEENKRDAVKVAELVGSVFTTFFLVLGLFSIAAGVLLIFTIFVMLAAERKSEMGIARAVGAQRSHLMESFLAEGMVYDVVAGAIGAALGVAMAVWVIVGGAKVAFGEQFSSLGAHVTARSLVISYCLGVVLTFITVVVSSLRVSRLNVVSAIRGIDEHGGRREGRRRTDWRWVAAGIPALIVLPLGWYWVLRKGFGLPWTRVLGPAGIAASLALTVVGKANQASFPFYTGTSLLPVCIALIVGYYGAPSRVTWSAVGTFLVGWWLMPSGLQDVLFGKMTGGMEMFVLSGIMIVTGFTLVIVFNARLLNATLGGTGIEGHAYRAPLLLGGAAITAVVAGLALGDRAGGLGQLFYLLAGLVTLATVMALVAVRVPSLAPALRMGVAYPLASRFRTGMTVAMFSLIIFSLVVMSVLNASFPKLFAGDEATGGWDITVSINRNNPIGDLVDALRREGSFDVNQISAVGALTPVQSGSPQEVRQAGREGWAKYPVRGGDDAFFAQSHTKLEGRAHGYESDRAVFEAVRSNPGLALVDSFPMQNQAFSAGEFDWQVKGVPIRGGEFEPFTAEIRDPTSGKTAQVMVIGVLSARIPSNLVFGVFTNAQAFASVYGPPDFRELVLRLAPGTDSERAAKDIKAALVTQGVQATSIQKQVDDAMAQSRGILRIFQAFMGLGLVVGIAALGVIAFRSVVERRQQIGMLRAIGYQRGTVALSFLIESSFIASMGILSGVVGAVILSWNLVNSSYFEATSGLTFFIPWAEVVAFLVIAYVFALLMTWWPSRRAASVPIADALRYE